MFEVDHELEGWRLAWARVELVAGAEAAAEAARRQAAAQARAALRVELLATDAVTAAVRQLFRAAGVDPTRYRPSSEALLRRVLRGEELPRIHPLVDMNNCLSVALAVPCCVMAEGTVTPPVRLRRGREGERMDSLRGELDLAGKPVLEDRAGPFGTPITDSRRVAVGPETRGAWMVAYLPARVLDGGAVDEALAGLAAIARVRERFDSG